MSKVHWFAPFKGVFTPIVKEPNEAPFLCVTFNMDYAPFIRGALLSMLQRQMWSGSTAEVDIMIMKVHQLLYMFGQETACSLPDDLTGEYEEMASLCESLRVQDGKLQALCCGEWVDIEGQAAGAGSGGTPIGDGAEQPAPGGCTSYHMVLNAQQQWILPTVVSAGDVISFENPKGTAQAIPGNLWYCPNGGVYFAGQCTGVFGTDGGDPMPAEAHMGLICQIAGVWYGSQDPITVPGGVVDAPVVFQVNDGDLADNSGGYSVDIEVCNNQLGQFSHPFNLRLSPGIWQVDTDTGDAGVWSAGIGYQAADPVTNPRSLNLIADIDPVTLTQIAVFFENVVLGTDPVPSLKNGYIVLNLAGSQVGVSGQTPTNGMTTHVWTGSENTDQVRVGYQLSSGMPFNTGSLTIWKIIVSGEGLDPF